MLLASKLIDTEALLKVVWVSLAAGVGGTAAFSLAIFGAARFADLRRGGRALESGMFAAVAAISLAICFAGVAIGLYAIINK
jgi:hypothetical protein